jgi:hypothetical protein
MTSATSSLFGFNNVKKGISMYELGVVYRNIQRADRAAG